MSIGLRWVGSEWTTFMQFATGAWGARLIYQTISVWFLECVNVVTLKNTTESMPCSLDEQRRCWALDEFSLHLFDFNVSSTKLFYQRSRHTRPMYLQVHQHWDIYRSAHIIAPTHAWTDRVLLKEKTSYSTCMHWLPPHPKWKWRHSDTACSSLFCWTRLWDDFRSTQWTHATLLELVGWAENWTDSLFKYVLNGARQGENPNSKHIPSFYYKHVVKN